MNERIGRAPDEALHLHDRALWWLIAGRLTIVGVLLGASAVLWSVWARNGADRVSFRSTLPIALAALALSCIYALACRFSALPRATQAGVQFMFDLLLVTWLVWTTGDLHSPYA
ncbi:MAG: hypothetical protein WCD76_20255, partial [Pyrinomonadaceae bacterium]